MPQELRPAALPTFRRALWPESGGFDYFVLAAAGVAWFFAGGIF
jgi:hypothetical protein